MDFEEEDYNLESGSDTAEDEAEYDNSLDEADFSSAATSASGQKQYKILKEEDIKLLLENDISIVCDVLSVPRGVACSLLVTNNWSFTSACDHWLAADYGIGERNPNPAALCKICHDETRPEKMASAACGHLFCAECWRTYIATALSDGGAACLTLCCPEPPCKAAVTLDMVESLSSEAEINDYNRHLLRSYVQSNPKRKWCPAAGCGRAVELNGEDYQVVCDCSHQFCWNCLAEPHRPVACKTAAEWMNKENRADAASELWILAYTKPCPKCKRPIQKHQIYGCNHMTCASPCHHDFCWRCGASWRGHICSNESDDTRDWEKAAALERYVHKYCCYEEDVRWHSYNKWIDLAMDNLERVRAKLDCRWLFVVEAWEQVVESLRLLKWSYAYGYGLSEEQGKTMFECMHEAAEAALERLRRVLVKEMIDDSQVLNEFKVKVMLYTSGARDSFKTYVSAIENDFPHVF